MEASEECISSRVRVLADGASEMQDSEIESSIGTLLEIAGNHEVHTRLHKNPLDAAVLLCEVLRGRLNADDTNSLNAKPLSAALRLAGQLGTHCGMSRTTLQRLLKSVDLTRSLAASSPIHLEIWAAFMEMLHRSSGIDAKEGFAESDELSLPHLRLRGGAGLCSCDVVDQPAESESCVDADVDELPKIFSKSPDVAEVVRKRIYAPRGVTFGAWVLLHGPPQINTGERGESETLWQYWEPDIGGWSLLTEPAGEDAQQLLNVTFVRLRSDLPVICEESVRVVAGTVPLAKWFPLTIEFKYQATGPALLRLQGTRNNWVHVNLGPQVNRSQFPPPSPGGDADNGSEDTTSKSLSCHARVAFFTHARADLAAMWLLEGNCSDEMSEWLKSLYGCKPAIAGGFWNLPSVGSSSAKTEQEKDHLMQMENDLWSRAVLGYVPGHRRDRDLVNYCVFDCKVGCGSFMPVKAGMKAFATIEQFSEIGQSSFMVHLLSPGWLSSLIWALARVLSLFLHEGEVEVDVPSISDALRQTFLFIFKVVARSDGNTQRGRAFADEGGFAVWSYFLTHFVNPVWLDLNTIKVLCQFLDEIKYDYSLARECWAQLFGPHMMPYWRKVNANVQCLFFTTLYGQCSLNQGHLDVLGGPEWILRDLLENREDMHVFCLRSLILFENYGARDFQLLWARLACLATSGKLAPSQVCALIVIVRCLALPSAIESSATRGRPSSQTSWFQEAVNAFAALCAHPDERVRVEAIFALRQLEASDISLSHGDVDSACASMIGSEPLGNCGKRSFAVLWAWLKCEKVQKLPLKLDMSLEEKLRVLQEQAEDLEPSSQQVLVDAASNFSLHRCGSGALLCAIFAVLDRIGDDSMCLRFLHDYKLLIGCSGEQTLSWWEALKSHSSVWHKWLLGCIAKNLLDDAGFLVAAKLHTMIISRAFTLDSTAWFLIKDMIVWASTPHSTVACTASAVAVCRALLVQLFEAVRASFEVQLRDASNNVHHPLCVNLVNVVHLLDSFLLSEPSSSRSLRLGQGNTSSNVWLDYMVIVQLLRLWSVFVLRDPLQNQPVLGFDLNTWVSMRWQRRPFPFDGVTEQVLFDCAGQSDTAGSVLFMQLVHWGTRCLVHRAPTESVLSSSLSAQIGNISGSPAVISIVAAANDIQMAQIQKEILLTLRNFTMCLLAVGSHAMPPVSQIHRETLGVAIVSFCAHVANFSDLWRKGHLALRDARQEAKNIHSEAREHATDVLLLLLLLCCQKWGRPAAGFTEQDLRACAESSEFPCNVLRMLSKLQWDKVAADLRELLVKQPGPKTWLGSTTPWMDPVRTMEGSLFSFVFSPGSSRSSTSRAARASQAESSNRRERSVRHRLLEEWGFQAAVAKSSVANLVLNPIEALGSSRGSSDAQSSSDCALNSSNGQGERQTSDMVRRRSRTMSDSSSASGGGSKPREVVLDAAVGMLPVLVDVDKESLVIPPDALVAEDKVDHLSQILLPPASLEHKSTRQVDSSCRRLELIRREWTKRAWQTICRVNRTPGSIWHDNVEWVHPAPPLPPVLKQREQPDIVPGLDYHFPGSPYDHSNMISQAGQVDKFSRGWRKCFSGSTMMDTRRNVGCSWTVDRMEDASARRPMMRLGRCGADTHDAASDHDGFSSDSSSSYSVAESSDDCEAGEDFLILRQECTWIRREGNCPCTLRLSPNSLRLYYDPIVDSRCSRSRTKRRRSSSKSSPPPTPEKTIATALASAMTRKRRRLKQFSLRNLSENGIHPRRFLHRHTALELRFTDGSAPLRLHFDEEAPAPSSMPRCRSEPADQGGELGDRMSDGRLFDMSSSSSSNLLGLAAGLTGSLGHGLGSASAAATAMLGRTTSLWSGPGGSASMGRHRGHDDVSVRDEVWLRLVEIQQCLQQEVTSPTDRSLNAHGHLHNTSELSVSDASMDLAAYEPPLSWALGCCCRNHMFEPISGSSSTYFITRQLERDALELPNLTATDTKNIRRQYQEETEKMLARITAEWQHGELSNFGYLQTINFLSGRSNEDLSQYPVFPWILQNLRHHDSPSTVLSRGDHAEWKTYFRDLSRTLGDLGEPHRREQLQQKYLQAVDPELQPYHYGTHFSTPAFVMHYLLRVQPFTDLAQALQGGRFDVPDRIFYSLPATWRSCISEMSDVRELIPEMFSLPECLLNLSDLNFGIRQDGTKVGDVELPYWARDVYHFVSEHRLALESEPVSKSIHGWIDLVWGCKQTGQAAIDALNVFYPLTYASGVNWALIPPEIKHSTEQQVLHFGQTPLQIFNDSHPARDITSWAPSLLRPAMGTRQVRSWHSSTLTSNPKRHGLINPHKHQAAVVALGAHIPQNDVARLFVIQADGALWCYRLRHAHAQATEPSGPGSTFSTFSWTTTQDHDDAAPPQMDLEANYSLPDTEDGIRERFLIHHDVVPRAPCWAFLPERRYFVRGGFRDGSIIYGVTADDKAGIIEHAHATTVSAVAVSRDCARFLPGILPSASTNGLLLISGALDGSVSVWAAIDADWKKYISIIHWHLHFEAVRCLDFESLSGVALSASEDGFVHVYRLRPAMRPIRSFRFQDGSSVSEARFASKAPATIVACSKGRNGSGGSICVWAMHGFMLAKFDLSQSVLARGLRVLSEGVDAQEGILFSTSDGHMELRSLPYLQLVWRKECHGGLWSCATDTSPARRMAWVGHTNGSFEVLCSDLARCRGANFL